MSSPVVDCSVVNLSRYGVPEVLAQVFHALLCEEPSLGFGQLVPIPTRNCRGKRSFIVLCTSL